VERSLIGDGLAWSAGGVPLIAVSVKGALATGIESAGGCSASVLGDLSNVDGVAVVSL